ncbi:MAG: hypothetical protein MRJ96_13085 [Nitrospirales bacterium]|nr:hypothetical protein [Nitrospira sp.]MDR4502378.1 hypothetical protein [Nitrospirales bacterium]
MKTTECDLKERMHVLANKLLPITVFSQLAVRHCQDPQILNHLRKIQMAAEEARVIVAEIQSLDRRETTLSMSQEPISRM